RVPRCAPARRPHLPGPPRRLRHLPGPPGRRGRLPRRLCRGDDVSTAPFDPVVAQVLTTSHRQHITALVVPPTGDPFPLPVDGFNVSWDEDRSPRVIVEITTPATMTAAEYEILDPRRLVRLEVTVAYRLPDGTDDAHQVG